MTRMSNRWAATAPVSFLLLAVAAPAQAANPEFPQTGVCEWPTALSYGLWVGHETGSQVLQEKSVCGGVYLTNGYFVTAAHCVDLEPQTGIIENVVRFGNHFNNDDYEVEVEVEYCEKHPGGYRLETGLYAGPDVAICRMMEVFEMSTTPILVPDTCENDYLREQLFFVPEANDPDLFPYTPYGLGVAPVPIHVAAHGMESFFCTIDEGGPCVNGNQRDVGSYIFHEFNVAIGGINGVGARWVPFMIPVHSNDMLPDDSPLDLWADAWPTDVGISGPGLINPGDSGSPMYVQMADGTWRAIGVASQVGFQRELPCAAHGEHYTNFTLFTPIPIFLPWMEDEIANKGDTTTDLTPCHEIGVVDGKETYVYTWGAACADAVSHYALDPDDNDVQFSLGCALDEGGDDHPGTQECAGWSPPIGGYAAAPAPSEAELWLQGALGGPSVEPAPGTFLDLSAGVGVYGDESDNVMTIPLVVGEKRRIFLGEGTDTLVTALPSGTSGISENDVIAGPGDDFIMHLGESRDLVFPGYGRDTVDTGSGNDTVVVLGGCEFKTWEVYRGGSGTDTFVSPLSACELAKRGIEVTGFEAFITTATGVSDGVCADPDALPPLQNTTDITVAALIAAACT